MSLPEIILIAISLAMDAFAVSVAAGTSGWMTGGRAKFRLSFHVGLFQFMMPIIGWFAGTHIAPIISAFDHWVAFGLLVFVGYRMIAGGLHPERQAAANDPSRGAMLVVLSVATSIDALAVGFSLALVNISIWYPAVIIGMVTSALSLAGIRLGRFLGEKIGPRMEIIGGTVLILIGCRILVTDLLAMMP
ncbi:MAG: manganese efflux pump MntP family protein [Thermodesulfobacteriota bacterium]